MIGKPCPHISGLTVVKGEPVAIPSTSGPTVVEFWASWCGPCRAAFPHLSALQRKYKDSGLRVVGVCLEDDSPQTRHFVERQGSNMDYTVVVDSGGQASQGLMGAAGVSGIPHAFVVDARGVVRHHGHPMDPRFEQTVQQVCQEAGAAAPPPPQKRALPPVTQSGDELRALPVRELKQILTERNIKFDDLHEKQELVERIVEQCSRVTYYV